VPRSRRTGAAIESRALLALRGKRPDQLAEGPRRPRTGQSGATIAGPPLRIAGDFAQDRLTDRTIILPRSPTWLPDRSSCRVAPKSRTWRAGPRWRNEVRSISPAPQKSRNRCGARKASALVRLV